MKDPAVLLYVNDWLNSTAAMEADCRGWYLNLILHNYDKGSLPNDIETLAVLCNVKYSEFSRFEQVFKQVLKQKFEENEDGTISNARTQKILQAREVFKEKRSEAGKKSYLIRFFAKNYPKQYKIKALKDFVLENINTSIDLKNEQVLEQEFEQMFELYRNVNANAIVNEDNGKEKEGVGEKEKPFPTFAEFWKYTADYILEKKLGETENWKIPIEAKYNAWSENNWKDGNGNKISNWKTKIQNTIPYLKPINNGAKPQLNQAIRR